MGTPFDSTKPTIYIINLETNNLYGMPMSYPMPESVFTWLSEEKWSKIDWVAQREDQYTGYFGE